MLVLTEFEGCPKLFRDPAEIISCFHPEGLESAFARMERFLKEGFTLAGFLSYEAGYSFESRLRHDKNFDFPLLCMGCFTSASKTSNLTNSPPGAFRVSDIRSSVSFEDYEKNIQRIRDEIFAGGVYQITYCLKKKFSFAGNAFSLYRHLLNQQKVPYPAFIDTGERQILSLSPELFLKKRSCQLITKPMKGTWPRGAGLLSDIRERFRLKNDEKNRAENLMITDLLRNDLGRIGSAVRVKRLFEVSGYTTLFQMTSTVASRIRKDIPLFEIFRALFPSGSVTGAPRMRSMEIIRGLEPEERKIYTGAIGYITPERDLTFNIPIRTLLIEGGRGEMGIGGGIVWDSTPEGEWSESELKASFLTDMKEDCAGFQGAREKSSRWGRSGSRE